MSPARDQDQEPETRIPAIGVSRGVGIGHIVEFRDDVRYIVHHTIAPEGIEPELSRFRLAVEQCRNQIEGLADDHANQSDELSAIFRVQLFILLDPELLSAVELFIEKHHCNAEWAVSQAAGELSRRQSQADDAAFKEKRLDLEDVCDRLLSCLGGATIADKQLFDGAVILAKELRPSTILDLQRNGPAALITERGGWTSHASIVAREFRIPMVSGVRAAECGLRAGYHAIVDGDNGVAIVHPSVETVQAFTASPACAPPAKRLGYGPGRGATMRDGTRITLRSNADTPESYRSAYDLGAEGIGLFRSESLIRRPGRIPSEDEQVESYLAIVEAAGNDGVKIRTFDIGIERYLPYGGTAEQNPALGLRSIRLSLRENEYFRSQIRAILRAALAGKVDIVLPMVAGSSELIQASGIIAEERRKLAESGVAVGPTRLGAMIEVPSAVLTAGTLAQRADFLSLGTNDLVQYLLAVDRDNYAVADWYQTLHPAVLQAIASVVESARTASVPLVVCGEMAASPFYLPVLIGLGVREVSLNVNSISQIRTLLQGITLSECEALLAEIILLETVEEIESALGSYYQETWSDLVPRNLLLK